MRNLIIGIIAVIVLDIGFVTYVKNDNAADITSAVVNTTENEMNLALNSASDLTETPELAESEPLDATTETGSTRPEIAAVNIPERRMGRTKFGMHPAKKERRRPNRLNSYQSLDLYALLKPITIEIPNAESRIKVRNEPIEIIVDRPADISEHPAKDTPKPDNKSFVASVLPVIKKPWDWIRAIGSKLK